MTAEMHRRGFLTVLAATVAIASLLGATDEAGSSVVNKARARAKEILRTHQVEPLPDDVNRHLDEIMTLARRNLVKE